MEISEEIGIATIRACTKFEDELIENLYYSCQLVCQLCIRLNPQHKDCPSCDELEDYRKPIVERTDKSWEQIKKIMKA